MPEPVIVIGLIGGITAMIICLSRRYFIVTKEALDILFSPIILILISPLLLAAAIIIKASSRGPIIYSQIRVGKDGKLFRIYKLRSMYINAESASGPVWACRDDPRVIPACRWMRRSHVDELPQLFNVIRGEMSLIGPRPERPEILDELEKLYPDVRKRLLVKPGITGLAQVRHGYDTGVENVRKKLIADLEYIEKTRWTMELSILVRTFTKLNDKEAR